MKGSHFVRTTAERAGSFVEKVHEAYCRKVIAKNGFWFIDIPRTSSTTIRVQLAGKYGAVYGKRDIVGARYRNWAGFPPHRPAVSMRTLLGAAAWDNLFTFSIVRNPWDRIFSLYRYRKRFGHFDSGIDYLTYLEFLYEKKVKGRTVPVFKDRAWWSWYGCLDYLVDEDGAVIVDSIVDFDSRDDGLSEVYERLGIREATDLHLQSVSGVEQATDPFDARCIELIGEIYEKEIAFFGWRPPVVEMPHRSGR